MAPPPHHPSARALRPGRAVIVQVRDAGNLLTRAELSLPAVDVDAFTMRYGGAADLVEHLRVSNAQFAWPACLICDYIILSVALVVCFVVVRRGTYFS